MEKIMKNLKDLINTDDPAWAFIQEWQQQATNAVKILPRNSQQAEQTLLNIQVTTRSPMGAIIYETGGILVKDGWLRILGSGNRLFQRRLDIWNEQTQSDGFLLIADDVVGGYFALNGGGLGENLGMVYYFAPDTLAWESFDIGYSDFIYWAFCGDVEKFYQSFFWQDWQADIASIHADQVFSFYPFLWTSEGKNINDISKKAVPILEDYKFKQQISCQ